MLAVVLCVILSRLTLCKFLSLILFSILMWQCSVIIEPPVDLWTTDSPAHHRTYCSFVIPVKRSLGGFILGDTC